MRRVTAAVLMLAMCNSLGCATLGNKVDPTKMALNYYRQERTYQPVTIKGIASLTLTAPEGQTIDIRLTSQLEPLSVYPRDPSTLATFFDGIWKLGTVIVGGIFAHDAVKGMTRGPTVVEPTVVTVPR